MKSLSLFKRFKVIALSGLAALSFNSCIDGNAVITITPTGSGTLAASVKVTPTALAFMKKQNQGADPMENLPKEEDLREGAKKMGEGVTLTKCDPIKDGTEIVGYNIEYAFTDIRKLNLGAPDQEKKVKLDFTPGKSAKLALEFDTPKEAAPAVKAPEKAAPAPANDPQAAMEQQMMLAMVKQIAAGAKVKVIVKAGSKITKTTATHVKGNEITIVDINLDEVMTDPGFVDFLKGMQTMEEGVDPSVAIMGKLEKLKTMKGIKAETNPKFEVSYE